MPSRSHSLHSIAYSHSQVYLLPINEPDALPEPLPTHHRLLPQSGIHTPTHEPNASGSHFLQKNHSLLT
jgi:hypothetical protein